MNNAIGHNSGNLLTEESFHVSSFPAGMSENDSAAERSLPAISSVMDSKDEGRKVCGIWCTVDFLRTGLTLDRVQLF